LPDIILSTINAKWIHPSLALRLLKANLRALEFRCEILEFALRQPLAEKTDPILAARPRILGISVSIWNHTATLELLDALDSAWADEGVPGGAAPRPVIVLGGPEASFLQPDAALFRYANYVIRGEGEIAFRELCARILEPAPAAILPGATCNEVSRATCNEVSRAQNQSPQTPAKLPAALSVLLCPG
jgi:hypothetical protein